MAPVLHHLATSDTKSSPDMSTIKPYTSNTDSPQDTEKHSLPDLGDTGAGTHHGDTDANVPTISTVRMCFLTAAMLLTWFLGTASAASVTLLLPVMVQDLNSNDLEMQWVVSAYTLAFGCGLLFTGRLADMYGRRKLYLIGLLTFLVFTAITGGLRNRVAMCFTRALSGLGLATAFPAGFGIVGSTIKREPARTIAFSLFGLGTPAGAFLGGLLAGGISTTNRSGWSYFFFVLAGVAAVNTAMAWFAAPHDPSRAQRGDVDRRIDWVGGVLVTAAICLFAFAFTDSGLTPKGWAAPHVPALLATSIVLFVLFYFWSRHLERNTSYPPIIKTSLFTRYRGRISAICICAFFASASVYSWVFTTAVFYQGFMRLTPWGNAIKILTSNITGICASLIIMIIAPRIKAPYILITAVTASGICSTLMAVRPEMSSFWSFEFPSQLLFPWGHDLTMTIGSILVSNLVEEDEQSVGGALFQTAGQIGGSLGICLSALISSEVTKDAGNLLMGLKGAYWFSAGTAFIIVPIVLVGLHGVGLAKNVRQAM